MKLALWLLTIASLIILISVFSASGTWITQHLSSDSALVALLTDTLFIAEGRIGDLGGSQTFELDIGPHTANPAQTAQYDWPNGVAVPFTVSYDEVMKEASFAMGGTTLVYSPIPGFEEIFVRTRAVDENTSVVVDELILEGEAVGDISSASGPDGLDILWIRGATLSDGFVFTGQATLSWSGTPPTQSRLAFQIKVAKLCTVPVEETTWGRIKKIFK